MQPRSRRGPAEKRVRTRPPLTEARRTCCTAPRACGTPRTVRSPMPKRHHGKRRDSRSPAPRLPSATCSGRDDTTTVLVYPYRDGRRDPQPRRVAVAICLPTATPPRGPAVVHDHEPGTGARLSHPQGAPSPVSVRRGCRVGRASDHKVRPRVAPTIHQRSVVRPRAGACPLRSTRRTAYAVESFRGTLAPVRVVYSNHPTPRSLAIGAGARVAPVTRSSQTCDGIFINPR